MSDKVETSINDCFENDPSVGFKLVVKLKIHVDKIEEREGFDLKVYLKKRDSESLCYTVNDTLV